MRRALVRELSPRIVECELTHLARAPIDFARATTQHAQYVSALTASGCEVEYLTSTPELPDSVFVEDTAVILDQLAVITRPGAASRRPETATVASALAAYRSLRYIEEPGTLDGGDVLRVGRVLFVGLTPRSNRDGAMQLAAFVQEAGYRVCTVPVHGCLHLKSAVTEISDDTLLINRSWTDASVFSAYRLLDCDPSEPFGANALRLGRGVIFPAEFPRTGDRLRRAHIEVRELAAGELAKAEGGVTCCSLIL